MDVPQLTKSSRSNNPAGISTDMSTMQQRLEAVLLMVFMKLS